MSLSLSLAAPAKINLFLHVTGKRPDHYHELETAIIFLDLCDHVTLDVRGTSIELTVTGPYASWLEHESYEDNLVIRAVYKLLPYRKNQNNGVHIILDKQIPVGAGLGGGSADAAAVLQGLNQLWRLNLSPKELAQIGLELGADVPVCLYQKPAFVTGIGDRISPLSLEEKSPVILLINPGKALATKNVFSQLQQNHYSKSLAPFVPTLNWKKLSAYQNDLEISAITLLPEINTLLSSLKNQNGCQLARMSGSGTTCFGLFKDVEDAEKAKFQLIQDHPHLWTKIADLKKSTGI